MSLQAIVVGNLGGDAETKNVGDTTVTEFSVATTRKVRQEKVTTWVRCQMWGQRGTAVQSYLTKGTSVTVIGELSVREFESKGEKRFSVECRVGELVLQGSKQGGQSQQRDHGNGGGSTGAPDDDSLPF